MTGIDLILKELQDSEARIRRGGRRKSTIGVSPKAASSPKATTTTHRNSNEEEKNSATVLPFHHQPSSSEEEFSLRLMSTDMLKNIDSMKLYAQNIRNTNAFMLMTINRCLDYAKASQGLKLTPKYETIDLRETLALPLTCMTNIQQKVKITLEPYSTDLICSHVVTDKQWLQENILCLLSNAVKYSSGGDVKILVSMQPRPPLNSSGKVLSVTHRDTLNSVDSVPLDESPPSPHRGVPVGSRSRASSDSIQTISKIVTDFVTGGGSVGGGVGGVVGRDAKVSPFSSFITNTTSTHHNHNNNINSTWYHAASASIHENNNSNNNYIVSSPATVPPPPTPSPSSSPQQSRYHRRINGGSGSDPHHNHNHSSSHHSSTGCAGTNHHNHGHNNRLMNDKDLDFYTEMMVFEIMDQGIGMSEEAMQSLFNPFQQTQKLAGGTGLGLYSLSKRIEALKGQYGVKKREDGLQGSVFWFSIPYRPDTIITSLAKRFMTSAPNTTNTSSSHHFHPPPLRFSLSSCDSADFQCNMMEVIEEHHPMVMISADETAAATATTTTTPTASGAARTRSCSSLTYSHSDKTHSNSASDSQATGTGNGTASKSGSFRSLNILLAEDTHSVAKMTTMMLKKMGHRVTLAENGEIALQKIIQSYEKTMTEEEATKNLDNQEMELELGLAKQKSQELVFDVVLMDLQMPVMDGLEATRRLREYEQKHYEKTGQEVHQMIIGVTAATDDETIEEGMNVGIDDFMPKPFSMDSLYSKVMSFLNNSSE
jgi:CheY-like chemotaxis protein